MSLVTMPLSPRIKRRITMFVSQTIPLFVKCSTQISITSSFSQQKEKRIANHEDTNKPNQYWTTKTMQNTLETMVRFYIDILNLPRPLASGRVEPSAIL